MNKVTDILTKRLTNLFSGTTPKVNSIHTRHKNLNQGNGAGHNWQHCFGVASVLTLLSVAILVTNPFAILAIGIGATVVLGMSLIAFRKGMWSLNNITNEQWQAIVTF